ncbi:MAG: DUF2806 domain-containing protein [Bacteroidota bacterium]
MSEFNLLKLEGKPLTKLIEVVSQGIGTLYRPRKLRKEADAKAYEIFTIERAKALAIKEGKEIELESYLRIQERLMGVEANRQNNIDAVVEIAGKELSEAEDISEEPINKDWTRRFFNYAQDVSDEEVQFLWGKILAGELKKPGSFSLKTLNTLSNLTRNEANILIELSQLIITVGSMSFIWLKNDIDYLKKYVKFGMREGIVMLEADILTSLLSFKFNLSSTEKQKGNAFYKIGNKGFVHIHTGKLDSMNITALKLTTVGKQLISLIEPKFNKQYFDELMQYISIVSDREIYQGDYFIQDSGEPVLKNKVKFRSR